MPPPAQLLVFALSIVSVSSLRQELPPYLPSDFAFGFGFTLPHAGTVADARLELEPHHGCDIDRLPSISPDEFNRMYRNKKPLILTEPADDTWTLNQQRSRSHAGEQDRGADDGGGEPWVRRGRWSRELLLHKLANATLKSGSAAKIALFLGRGYEARVPLGEYLEDMHGAEQQRVHGAASDDNSGSMNQNSRGNPGVTGRSSHFMEDNYGVDADFFNARRLGPDAESGDAPGRRRVGVVDSESDHEARQELFDSLRFPPALRYMLNSSTLSGRAWPEKLLHVGGTGTGVAPHWHGDTVSHLIHGRKHWVLYPPQDTPLKVDAYWPVHQRRWLEHVTSARTHRARERHMRHQEQEKVQRPPQPPPRELKHKIAQDQNDDHVERDDRRRQQRKPPPPPPPPPRVPLNDVAGAELRHRWEKAPEWAHVAEVESMYEEEMAGAQQFVNGSMHCVQRAGELIYVPDSWVHATINIGETVSVSTQQHPVPRALLWRLQLAVVGDGGGEPPNALDSVRMLSKLATEFAGNALVLFTMARVLGLAVQQGVVALPALQQQLEEQRQALKTAKHENEAERDAQLVRTMLRRQGEIVIATFERAARLCPSDPDFHFGVGEMSTYLGRKYQAYTALKQAEKLAPVDPQVQAALVHASQAIGHEEERLNRAKLQHKYANRTAEALRTFQNAAEAHDVAAAMQVVDQYVITNPSDKSLLRELQALLQQQFDEAHARKGPLDRLTERLRNGHGSASNSTV